MPTKSKGRAPTGEPAERVIDTTLTLAAERGWRKVSLADIAHASGLSLAQLYALYPTRGAILAAFLRRIDEAVLAKGEGDGDTPRDRLFDLLMRRFDALGPYKSAVEAIAHDAGADPVAALCGAPRMLRSMAWMLEAAGIDSHGLLGRARVKGLALVYLGTFRVWLSDDSPDLSRTMASLDKALRRAEGVASLCSRSGPRRRREGEAQAEATA